MQATTLQPAAAWRKLLPALVLFAAGACSGLPKATGPDAVLARFKAATGGDRWDAISTLETTGTIVTGGLSGKSTVLQDVRTGRSVSRYTLGSVTGADGFDGRLGWNQDAGGEVTTLDSPEAVQAARTAAWLGQEGYWYPARAPAVLGPPSEREEGGHRYQVIVATPAGGRPVTLWFDAGRGLLARSVELEGAYTVTGTYDDYRDAGGVRMPLHVITDRTDATGKTDPRARVELHVERVTANVPASDAQFAPPVMAPRTRFLDGSGVARVPFDLVNNHIYVDGTIGGARVRLLVDTGGANVLTPAAAKRLGLAPEGKLAAHGVGAETIDLALAHARDVEVGGALLSNPVFYVIDLGPLPRLEGVELDGLVGFEMFRRFRVTIDYAGRTLTLTTPDRFHPPEGAEAIPFELAERTPVIRATLDGIPARISIDTGSRASLTLHAPFARDHGLAARYGAAPERITGWGVGGPALGRPARLGALQIGGLTVKDIAGDVFTGDRGAFANPDVSANLGGGVLRRFTVAFDYDQKRMYLAPNAGFARPDPFDRSGMWLMRDGDALEVKVAAGGPAAQAGVTSQDRIASIDGEPVSRRPLAEWRQRLAELPAGTRVALSLVGPAPVADTPKPPAPRALTIVLADAIPEHPRP